jgi:uncharacterized protein
MDLLLGIGAPTWDLLLDSMVYVLFGLTVSGLARGRVNPQTVARHLGPGRFISVIKAASPGESIETPGR